MMMTKIVVLDGYTLNPGDMDWSALEKLGDLTVYDYTSADQIIGRAEGADIVLTNKTPLNAKTLTTLTQLKYIGVLATGYNVVDVQAASEHRITVTNIPAYSTYSVAQLVFAFILELCHHVQLHSDAVFAGDWSNNRDFCFWRAPLIELHDKTIGIIGYGTIGRQVARIAHAFGMNICVHSRTRPADLDPGFADWVDLDTLLKQSDIISLHCPLTPETQGLICENQLRKMKSSAFLINTSRGGVIVEQDLADALNNQIIAGAGLDVLSQEPPPSDNPLLSAKNCLITPHIAWATQEARTRLMKLAVENVSSFLNNKPLNIINPVKKQQ
ncbi:MAG: D-2-hydroxyacid dehydrogenase [Eubacteriales bacterium]|nr:D-2-hydroxyacid dehydrogenase [Eubacteriales bacterium]